MKTLDEINSYLIKRANVKTIKYEFQFNDNQTIMFYNADTMRLRIHNNYFRVQIGGLRFDKKSAIRQNQVKEVVRDLFDCDYNNTKSDWRFGELDLTDEQKLEFTLLYFS